VCVCVRERERERGKVEHITDMFHISVCPSVKVYGVVSVSRID